MFKYTIHKQADNKKFYDACRQIENNIKDLNAEKPIIDVDGSVIQIYYGGNDKIKVYNDYEVNAVYIDSEVNLDILFQNTSIGGIYE